MPRTCEELRFSNLRFSRARNKGRPYQVCWSLGEYGFCFWKPELLLYVDGGIVDNNPIHLLSDRAWGICQVPSEKRVVKMNNMFDYSVSIIQSIYNNVNIIKKGNYKYIIKLESEVNVTSFDITKDMKYQLIRDAIRETK